MSLRTARTSDTSSCTTDRRIAKRAARLGGTGSGSGSGSGGGAGGVCKSCVHCRQKKVRCDGARPQCQACIANRQECVYPQDGRRHARPSSAKVQSLEAGLALLWGQMKALGVLSPDIDMPDILQSSSDRLFRAQQTPRSDYGDQGPSSRSSVPLSTNDDAVATSAPTPGLARLLSVPHAHMEAAQASRDDDDGGDDEEGGVAGEWAVVPAETTHRAYYGPGQGLPLVSHLHAPQSSQGRSSSSSSVSSSLSSSADTTLQDDEPDAELEDSSLSPSEARVAGVSQHEGGLSVHGLSSILTPDSPVPPSGGHSTKQQPAREASTVAAMTAAAKARLVSNAALQRQRESRLFRAPRNTLDLDGVDPEMARHLLDLHWNRQHYAYLLTYRPAIMDSLAHGGGPWANKLLLNAIYYSSCLYSDRACLRADPADPQSAGLRFYTRFRQLLGDAVVEPSIPSAVALLLCGATLVSQGRASAGWTLCGTAYRMITDLGVHLMLAPAAGSAGTTGAAVDSAARHLLHGDMEREMRKRLYWGAFITDATQSLYLGRPPALALADARVPQLLLDTYEELEEWTPYVDYMAPSSSPQDALLRSYAPRPAHAVSTFQAMARLFAISSRMSRAFYGIDTVKQPGEHLVATRERISRQLEQWRATLRPHQRFDPDVDPVVPPHQITPHTTFHVLNIMLLRPFLAEGHLRQHSSEPEKETMARACIGHAMAIQKLVAAYRRAFTLRRAPFLLSYAVYSAVVVVLKRDASERVCLRDAVGFFWTALSELQRGCNFGLQKPLAILRQMMAEMGETNETGGGHTTGEASETAPRPDPATAAPPPDGMLSMLDKYANGGAAAAAAGDGTTLGSGLSPMDAGISPELSDPLFYVPDCGTLDFLDDQERIISDDALYGLFAPPQSFF
ncbi:Transcription factor [Niveomyces insectorum RCEF 264]|uniref:Transcription factor n=1 Tax=Niveomyces insectorum RCEF 264 TaxID=1081102 RepID=A0A162JGJ3_9HYPO|nr:Transcription factor [Niveomyces insectorum RCEF 264]